MCKSQTEINARLNSLSEKERDTLAQFLGLAKGRTATASDTAAMVASLGQFSPPQQTDSFR